MNPHTSKFEIRECATLGTLFADVYCDGQLFARELPLGIAELLVADPSAFSNVFADVPKLRTWIIEDWYRKNIDIFEPK